MIAASQASLGATSRIIAERLRAEWLNVPLDQYREWDFPQLILKYIVFEMLTTNKFRRNPPELVQQLVQHAEAQPRTINPFPVTD